MQDGALYVMSLFTSTPLIFLFVSGLILVFGAPSGRCEAGRKQKKKASNVFIIIFFNIYSAIVVVNSTFKRSLMQRSIFSELIPIFDFL